MQTFTKQFYINKKVFVLVSQVLFPVLSLQSMAAGEFYEYTQ